MNDKLSEILDIEPLVTPPTNLLVPLTTAPPNTQTANDDAVYAREHIRSLIETSVPTLENLIHIANASENPRAYEVVTQLLKTISDLNKDLMDVHKKEQELTKASAPTTESGIHVKNAVFVGTTKELRNHLKQENS